MKQISIQWVVVCAVCLSAFFSAEPQAWCASNTVYIQTNLVSDIPGFAQSTDPNLKNPWGVSYSATSPFWVSDTATNLSTLYQGTGATVNARVVSVPGGPTGEIQNSTTDFVEANGKTASFIFATLSGAIYAWNGTDSNNVAEQAATLANASFTGLAFANNGSGNFLYAANISGFGSVEVFDKSFAHVTLAGSFQDPSFNTTLFPGSAGYVPYNIQNINGQLYVEYVNFKLGKGAVSIFDLNGNFIKELIPPGGPQLNQPWGVAIAPSGFGTFANDVLVGNFGDGKINAFDPNTGAFLGTVSDFNGPIVNSGLWALSVRTGGTFNTNAVYITAGINNQLDGLFAVIAPVSATTVALTTPSTLPFGNIGTAYSQTLAVTGGTAPYSNWTVTNGSLPPGLSLNSTTGTISGTPAAVGGTFSFTLTVTDSAHTAGFGSFQITIQQPSASTPLARVGGFAQVASGGGWKTTMTLVNLSASTVNAQLNLYVDNGSPATMPLTFPEFGSSMTASSVNLTLSPFGSVVVQTAASTSTIAVGWADLQATGPLSGYLTFDAVSGGSTSEGSMPLDTRLSTSLLLPYDNTNGDQTALAIANQSAAPQTVTMNVYDQNGVQLFSAPMNLPAFGHSAFFVNSQFPLSANQLGVVQIQGSAVVTGIGLRFIPSGLFTSIPIIR
jgi:uncharacterized protein (TIGR03118 family)